MRHNTPVTTMAAALALALALLVGVLLPADSPVYADPPTWDTDTTSRSVFENTPPGVNIGDPISATDPDEATEEFGNTLTYSLEASADTAQARADAAAFDIDPSTGQLITKAPLNTEAQGSYTVRVRVDDGETGTNVAQSVDITVTNVIEAPNAPHPPTVVSGEDVDDGDQDDESTTSLKVVWHPPENTGTAITDYNVRYKKSTDTAFIDANYNGTTRTHTISDLEVDTSYDVRVQATGEATGPWSLVGTGSTNKDSNSPPVLNDDTPTTDNLDERSVAENTPAGENIGSPVTATDGDTTTLTYSLGGPDADLFNFNTRSGQIRTKSPLNHEDPRCYVENDPADTDDTDCFYYVTVTVVDGAGGSDAIGVTIVVNDRTETPSAPARPTVRATEKSSTSLDVSWNAPANMGPAITGYDVQYRKGTDPFSDDNCGATGADNCQGVTGTKVTIVDLDHNTTYEVRIKATNPERASAWSGTGNGRTNRANQEPIFDDRPGTGTGSERSSDGTNYTIWRTIDENPRSGQSVGRIFADDADNDRLTYKLVESADTADARGELSKFTIVETTGEIKTKAGETYSYEDLGALGTCGTLTEQQVGTDRCYTVKVEVRDGLDNNRVEDKDEAADDTITVKIGLRDRAEPPSVPTVMVTSPAVNTTLLVTWHARNTGPDITSYDVQYRKGGGTFLDDNCEGTTEDGNCSAITTGTTTITALDEDTSYSVQVRARNEEGTSNWSGVETVKTNKGTNDPPVFTDGTTTTRSLDENKSSTNVGPAVDASDTDTNVLTYELGGPDETLFSIVSTSGQIRTRSALNTEAICSASDADLANGHQENCNYTVWVKVDDRAGGSVLTVVTITVNDVDEFPIAPGAPRVTATKDTGQSLDVSWTAPRNEGKPPITDYDIRYREVKAGTSQDNWELWPHGSDGSDSTETSTKITRRLPAPNADPLKPRTQYEVRVRAKNGEPADNVADNWSSVAKATTGQSNSRPSFDTSGAETLRVDENTRAGQNVGNAISASDADSNSLTYTLEGPGKDSFTIVSSSGQIRTRSPLDHETRDSYSVTVKVDDRQRKANSVATKSVTIMVDDVREAPSPPAAPTVAGIPGSTSSVRVTWDEPANTGPAITGYDVHYREVGSGPLRWDHFGADRSTIITDLKAGTRYEVQVRARSDEGTDDWSRWGSGMPNPDVANRNPAFSGGSRSLSVAENTPPNTDVGAPISATDRDGDTLTYTLEGADADSFDILSTSDGGQIRTSAELNHEEKASYAVTVRVRDGRGGTDAVNVTIRVTDVDNEAPDTPFAPRVTAVSSSILQVTWEAPANAGPEINDYDYRYREPGGSWTEVSNTTITDTAVTIEGLAASTSYDVEVRATNAEGTSEWSNPGIGSTNVPGANNPPVFDDGTSATRSVSAAAPAGTNIGDPVAATDADTADTLTYSLEGRDAGLFDIEETSGQLLTRSGITLIVGTTYTVIVTADDGTDTARITVSIEATAAPPNNPPVFSEAPSTTRTVRDDATAGRNVGSPVTATDADTGDTITYTLEGTDAASFGIVASSGQIQTSAALDANTKSTYSVTVKATDSNGGSATIAVTITVTAAPVSYGCATNGAVDASNTGLVADCEALMASRNLLEGNSGRLNWSPATPINQWEGVSLRGSPARVTFLVLSSKSLDGTIPADLGRLPMLRWLNLRSNNLSGSIPSELNNLTRLERLLLHNNRLSGPIPNLSSLRSLKMLWLSGSNMNLSGGVPTWLNSMSSLEQLSLWGNNLGDNGTRSVPNLTGMTSLSLLKLQSNNLGGGVPAWFGNMDGPAILYLHDNELTGAIPANLGRNTGVIRLWLDRNNLNGEIPSELGGMTSLRTLNLRDNQLTGAIPSELGNLSSLQQLRLHNNQLTGTIPSELGNLSSLLQMWLSGNQLTGSIPASLGGMPRLRDLNLRANNLSGDIPLELGNLRNTLTRLRIGGTQVKDENGVVISEVRGNTGLTGCVPAQLSGATDADDLRLAGSSGLSFC
ncbi:MAG: hypothetical protein F4W93_12335 [Dehalococcoidia bacterium]|nr:hypothetical protein [Dehalococcoidia bacterium]